MERDVGKNSALPGLEPDRINLSDLSQGGGSTSKGDADESPRQSPDNTPKNSGNFRVVFFSALTILAVLVVLVAVSKKQDFSFNLFSGKSDNSQEGHLQVGPISATLSNDDIIRFSVDIDCGSENLKDRLSQKDSRIRDKIVSIITSPEAEQLLENRQYDALKRKIKKGLDDIATEPVDDVYFSDLITY